MKYDFDKIIDRSWSGDLKHEVLKARYGRDDLIALWVADMDFETPSLVLDAVKNRLQHPFVNKARLALNDGEIFDTALNPYATPLYQKKCVSRGFMRLNVGTPRSVLRQALSSWQKRWLNSGDGNVELTDHEHRTACRESEERNTHGCKMLRGQGPQRGEVDAGQQFQLYQFWFLMDQSSNIPVLPNSNKGTLGQYPPLYRLYN